MKMSKLITVPREKKENAERTESEQAESTNNPVPDGGTEAGSFSEEAKPDFMIPLSFQSDMGHIHQKAGFTVGGE